MPAVFNASPLIHLSRLTKMNAVRNLHREVYVPPAVYSEVVDKGKREGYSDAFYIEHFQSEGWLVVDELRAKGTRIAKKLRAVIGEGEAQAIGLAAEKGLTLVMDDDEGRRIAAYYGVETLTTLGLILRLALAKLIAKDEYSANIRRYAARGWITSDVVDRFLHEADRFE